MEREGGKERQRKKETDNKVVFTAALVTGGWAGAVTSWTGAVISWAGAVLSWVEPVKPGCILKVKV